LKMSTKEDDLAQFDLVVKGKKTIKKRKVKK